MQILIALLLLLCALSFAQDDAKPVPPVLITKVEPTYSPEALADHLSGSVLVSLTVGIDGVPTDIKVVKGLGEGLDEKAVEAVSQWRFQPGTKKGVPVAVQAQVSVNFKLLNDPQKAAASPASSDATAPSLISKVEPDYSKEAVVVEKMTTKVTFSAERARDWQQTLSIGIQCGERLPPLKP